MSCGVPVVATTVGAFPELVADGTTGTLVPPGDAVVMAEAAEAFLDVAKLRTFGDASRCRVLSDFRIEQEATSLVQVYRNLLGDRGLFT
jgi:mannosyltransferase